MTVLGSCCIRSVCFSNSTSSSRVCLSLSPVQTFAFRPQNVFLLQNQQNQGRTCLDKGRVGAVRFLFAVYACMQMCLYTSRNCYICVDEKVIKKRKSEFVPGGGGIEQVVVTGDESQRSMIKTPFVESPTEKPRGVLTRVRFPCPILPESAFSAACLSTVYSPRAQPHASTSTRT